MAVWYCTSCGGAGTPLFESLDPAHPFGWCTEKLNPCEGRRLLTGNLAELAKLQRTNKLAAARLRHREHMGPRGKLVPTCTYCIAIELQVAGRRHATP